MWGRTVATVLAAAAIGVTAPAIGDALAAQSAGPAPQPPCEDATPPESRFTGYRITFSGMTLRGESVDATGCGEAVASVRVSLARVQSRGRCRPVTMRGRLRKARRCGTGPLLEPAMTGASTWSLRILELPPKGRYVATVRATDASGNAEAPGADNRLRLRVR